LSLADATKTEGLKLVRYTVDLSRINMLVYSEPGVGKTHLIGQADKHPQLGPTFYIDTIDAGMLTLSGDPPLTWKLSDPDITDDALNTPENKLRRFEQAYHFLRAGDHEFKSVAIDTLGGLIRTYHSYLSLQGKGKGKRESIHEVQRQDYNDTKNYVVYWLQKYLDLPLHFFVTCHEEAEQRADGVEITRPLVFQKLAKPVEALFDIVGNLIVSTYIPKGGDGVTPVKCRKLVVEYDATDMRIVHAKGRLLGEMGAVIINPTMSIIYNRIKAVAAKRAAETAPTQPPKQTPNTGD
jgi:hypothetical protein